LSIGYFFREGRLIAMLIEDILGRLIENVKSTMPVADSFSSEVYSILVDDGQTVYCKIPFTKEKWYREYKCLNYLVDSLNVPKIINVIEPTETFNGAFLLTALEGNSITSLTPKLAKGVGELHAKLHEISSESYGSFTNEGFEILPNNDWRMFIWSAVERFAPLVRQTISEELFESSIIRLQELFKCLPAPEPPSFVHMDFRLANLIAQGDTLLGVIDFESSRFGSPEIDFIKLYREALSKDAAIFNAYQIGYGSVRPLLPMEQYVEFYSLYDAFNSIGWCTQRGLEKNRGFYEESLKILKTHMELSST
jgi:aminoglycoside phosphotransferase (APT) family kinase protein